MTNPLTVLEFYQFFLPVMISFFVGMALLLVLILALSDEFKHKFAFAIGYESYEAKAQRAEIMYRRAVFSYAMSITFSIYSIVLGTVMLVVSVSYPSVQVNNLVTLMPAILFVAATFFSLLFFTDLLGAVIRTKIKK